MKHGTSTSTLLLCSLASLLLAQGCGSSSDADSGSKAITYVPNGSPAACSSNIDVCGNVTPRVEVTVKDESGNPIQYAMVNSYYPGFSLSNLDANTYPAKDGFGRKKSYFTCTNDEGKAMLCGWDGTDTNTGSDIDIWRSGYLPTSHHFDPTASPVLGDGAIRTLDATLSAAASVDQTSKVLFLACYTGDESRLPYALTYESVAFTVAGFGEVVDALLADPEHPLANFDTLVLDTACSWYEPYEELLVAEKNARLWSWIEAGGRVIFGEPNYTGWNTSDPACPTEPCSNAFFPQEYRFEFIPKSRGTTDDSKNCARFKHGTIADASHPFVQGVTFDNWSYVEYRQAAATEIKENITWGATWGSTVDSSLWNVVMTASSDQAEVDSKPGCWQNDPTLARTDAAVALMEAKYGSGSVFVIHSAWIQATNGERTGTGQTFAADAVVLKNNIINYILHR